MKTIILTILVATTAPALAWDGPGMWYAPAAGTSANVTPGGAGITGTGSQHDYGIKCSDCHVNRTDEPALAFAMTFSPTLTNGTYVPGQRYTITAQLTGARLGIPCAPPGTNNVDNFAATFEDDTGAAAGMLATDGGQSAPNCTLASPPPAGSTFLDGDCKVVFGGGKDTDRWTFTWTAPSTSTAVHIFWGAVDGNCDMMSMNDAVLNGSQTLAAPPTAREPPPRLLTLFIATVKYVASSAMGNQ